MRQIWEQEYLDIIKKREFPSRGFLKKVITLQDCQQPLAAASATAGGGGGSFECWVLSVELVQQDAAASRGLAET